MTEGHVISEHPRVEEMEDAFLTSCKHNQTGPADLAYFRRYVWQLFAILIDRFEQLERTDS